MSLLVSTLFVLLPSSSPSGSCNPTPTPAQVDGVCADFCSGKCSFDTDSELPAKPHTIKVFRETPINVTTLNEKNSGTINGDIGFYLSNHNLAYTCAVFPKSDDCVHANAIEKNSQSNIFIEFDITIDGEFGPYQMCNPEH